MSQFDSTLEYWVSGAGAALLEAASEALEAALGDALRAGAALRKRYDASQARDALEIAALRFAAREFGAWTRGGFFTRQSLEQATAPPIAALHAERFRGARRVLEICAGAGFDTAALARALAPGGGEVVSVEADERLAAMARQNLAAQGVRNVEIVCGRAEDVARRLDLTTFDGCWCDPSRRTAAGKRLTNPADYSPPLGWLQSLPIRGAMGVKLSPAATLEASALGGGFWREWIGWKRECREQVLWRGAQNESADGTVRLADAGVSWAPPEEPLPAPALCEEPPAGAYLLEPHGCLIRCGRLADFFAERGWFLLHPKIAYGAALLDVSGEPPPSPFYQRFRILEFFPYNLKILRRRLRELGWGGDVEIKKRGFPLEPEELRARLALPANGKISGKSGVALCARLERGYGVFLAERV